MDRRDHRGTGVGGSPSRRRAAALPAHERRRCIVEATLPLLLEHGTELTTRQIAEASGIAEGTVFRAFPDKESVIDAVLVAAFDPTSFELELAAIDLALPLVARLERCVTLLQQRVLELGQLLAVSGRTNPPVAGGRPPTSVAAIAQLFEPDRADLRVAPLECAEVLRGLTLAFTHPALAVGDPRRPSEIVSLALDGVRSC